MISTSGPRPFKPSSARKERIQLDMSDGESAAELRNFLGTTSFGAKVATKDLDAAYARTRRNVPVKESNKRSLDPEPAAASHKHAVDQDQDSMEDSSDEDELELPISHEIVLSNHARAISGLSLETSGSRLASGGHDGQVALWDFSGMSASHRPFKVLETFESHQIRSIDFNCSNELILVTATNWQPKIITREGENVAEMPRGDPYLREMKNTKGHVGEVTTGAWNPKLQSQCITASADATIRLWDTNNVSKNLQVLVHKPKTAGAGKVKCTTASYAHDGKSIGGAYLDGTISLWATDGPYHRPMGGVVSIAHTKNTETSSLAFSLDGWSLASRGSDCVKLWDRRKFRTPLAVLDNLPNQFSESSIIFSPNNQELLVPTSDSATASVRVLSSKTLVQLQSIAFDSPVIKVLYHSKLNQIVTGHADGNIRVLYSPEKSTRGAKLVLARAPKARHVDDLVTANIDEAAGEVGQDEATILALSSSRARNAARKDPKKSNMPELPGTQRYAERKVVGDVANFRDQDPQKELLKYDEAAKKDPMFFGIYNKNQPVTQFAALEEDNNDGEKEEAQLPANKRFKFTPKK